MSRQKLKRLSGLIWRERIRSALIVGSLLLAATAAIAFISYNGQVARTVVSGTVTSWSRAQTDTGYGAYIISVMLEDGSMVVANGSRFLRKAPRIGETIRLARVKTALGSVRYEWRQDD